MYKIVKADKDAYITDKVVRSVRMFSGNVGSAGTLDLFKLYGMTYSGSTPCLEKSRILIHFDLDPIRDLLSDGKIDTNDSSFWCKLIMKDVYGGQTTPTNFAVSVFPLSASFTEGTGRDVSYYSDYDVCNWLSSSSGVGWYVTGCSLTCDASTTTPGDYITSSAGISDTESTQLFVTGDEDLEIDVTSVVSATLAGALPDNGFRISFENSLEENTLTYFVKRFASRTAYDESKHPKLVVGYDDSIFDDTQNMTFDTACDVSLYNYAGGNLSNIVSGSSLTQITGDNCLLLKISTEVSGGYYDMFFTGSQFSYGSTAASYVTGTYTATVTIPSTDSVYRTKIAASSSVKVLPIWSSLDNSVGYVTGSELTVYSQSRVSHRRQKNYVVNVLGIRDSHTDDEEVFVRVNIFDHTSPLIKATRVPVELAGIVVREVYYQVRDAVSSEVVIPFDDTKNSTRVSSDSEGMFFTLDASNLTVGKSYTIDLMIANDGTTTKFMNASPVFRIESA